MPKDLDSPTFFSCRQNRFYAPCRPGWKRRNNRRLQAITKIF